MKYKKGDIIIWHSGYLTAEIVEVRRSSYYYKFLMRKGEYDGSDRECNHLSVENSTKLHKMFIMSINPNFIEYVKKEQEIA
jgi:ASC-1-like (ASCH) protein